LNTTWNENGTDAIGMHRRDPGGELGETEGFLQHLKERERAYSEFFAVR